MHTFAFPVFDSQYQIFSAHILWITRCTSGHPYLLSTAHPSQPCSFLRNLLYGRRLSFDMRHPSAIIPALLSAIQSHKYATGVSDISAAGTRFGIPAASTTLHRETCSWALGAVTPYWFSVGLADQPPYSVCFLVRLYPRCRVYLKGAKPALPLPCGRRLCGCVHPAAGGMAYSQWTPWDSNPGPTGYEPGALTN